MCLNILCSTSMGQRGRRCIRHSVRYLCSFKHARICEVQPPKADCSSGRSQTISFKLECNTCAYMFIWSSVKSLSELWSPSLLKCMTECILRWWLLMDCSSDCDVKTITCPTLGLSTVESTAGFGEHPWCSWNFRFTGSVWCNGHG
jgi:hypothetical protein